MRRRQHHQIDGVAVEAADLGARTDVVRVVVVGARNELRLAGRSAGQQQYGHVAGVGHGQRGRGGVEVGERGELGGVARHQDVLDAGHRLAQGPGQRAVVEAVVQVRDRVGRGAGHLGDVHDLALAMRGQGEHRYRARPQQREEEHHERVGAGELDDHPVAAPDAEPPQPRRHPVGAQIEFGVRPPVAVGVDECGPPRRPLRAVPQQSVQRPAFPVALCAVLLGQRLRPGHPTVEHPQLPPAV